MTSTLSVSATTGDLNTTEGSVVINSFEKKERLVRAFKKLVLFWVIAIFSIFLPAAHFVLVPLFFLLGLLSFRKTMKAEGEVLEGRILCPHCSSEVLITKEMLVWPLKEICQSCVRVLQIRPTASKD